MLLRPSVNAPNYHIESNPEKHLHIPTEEWIKIVSKDYSIFPPTAETIFRSDFTTLEVKDIWSDYRKKLLQKQKEHENLLLKAKGERLGAKYNFDYFYREYSEDTPKWLIEKEIRDNPKEYLFELSERDWIRVVSGDYMNSPPNVIPVFKSNFQSEKLLIQNNKNLWEQYRKELINEIKKLKILGTTEKKIEEENNIAISKEKHQKNQLKEYINLHKEGLITKEALTELQIKLLSKK